MKTIYIFKRDPDLPATEDNWIVMSKEEYIQYCKSPEGKARRIVFAQLDACGLDDVIIKIECDGEAASDCRKYKDHHDYLQEQRKKSGYSVDSLYENIPETDEDCFGEEAIVEPFYNMENDVLDTLEIQELYHALECLSPEELMLIIELYLSPDRKTEAECGRLLGISRKKLRYTKERALQKLRKKLDPNRFSQG